jgi:histidyl-tRNA synthetase
MNTVKGFQDFVGEDSKKREAIRKILVETFERYGFEPMETPVIEYEEFVKGDNASDEAVSDIFKLQDKGKRKLALRYEFTFQLKRLMKNQKLPLRRYQIGPVFRDEPVSGNRVRQFVQCDVDVVGSTIKDEAEILALAKEIMKELKIPGKIYFNNRKLMNEVLESVGVKKKIEVIKEIDKLDKLSEKEVVKNLKKFRAEKVLGIFKNKNKLKKYSAYADIENLQKYLKAFKVNAEFLPTLARGLSYYNGTIFEIKSDKMKETITGGGSFMFNGIQSTGISFGLDRLAMVAEINLDKEKTLVVSLDQNLKAIQLAQKLRDKGKKVDLISVKNPSKALGYANAKKIGKVIFVGAKEVKKKVFKVKNMTSGKEVVLKIK